MDWREVRSLKDTLVQLTEEGATLEEAFDEINLILDELEGAVDIIDEREETILALEAEIDELKDYIYELEN